MSETDYPRKIEKALSPYLVERMAFDSSRTYRKEGKVIQINPKNFAELEKTAISLELIKKDSEKY